MEKAKKYAELRQKGIEQISRNTSFTLDHSIEIYQDASPSRLDENSFRFSETQNDRLEDMKKA